MSYTNRLNSNPIRFTNDIEIRSGTAGTYTTVAAEYVTLGYEPGIGSQYLSTSGEVFIHTSAGTAASNWSSVSVLVPSASPSASPSISPSISPSPSA